jgi:uncharacterized membrane protein
MDDTDRLEPADSDTALQVIGNFYRGEVDRMTVWRSRLDQTTNWAVVFMAATLTFGFSSTDNPHYVLLLGALGVLAFLTIESQRYQEYDAWRNRVRLMQRNLLADTTDPGQSIDEDWREQVGADLRRAKMVHLKWRAPGC